MRDKKRVPSDLQGELRDLFMHPDEAGNRDRLKQLIERCKAYSDGHSVLWSWRWNKSVHPALAKDLDDAIRNWQAPRPPEPVKTPAPDAMPRHLTEESTKPRTRLGFWKRLFGTERPHLGPDDAGVSRLQEGARRAKGKPNPSSRKVAHLGQGGTSSRVEYLCPACSMPNTALDVQMDDLTGALATCVCGTFSHVPAAYKRGRADASGLAIYSAVRVPIADFFRWMSAHPSFRAEDIELYGSYGLWALCAGCHHRYASTVLASLPMMLQLGTQQTIFMTHSGKSGQDAEAIEKQQCPRCGNPDLLALIVDIPKYVRDAVDAEKKRRGLR